MLAFDPGGTTGVAVFAYYPNDKLTLISHHQIPGGLSGFLAWWHDQSEAIFMWDEIVCESFILRPGVHGADITPAYVIGAIKAMNANSRPFIEQQPSMKMLCSDETLKKFGMYQKGKPHANDAIRHGIISLRNRNHKFTVETGWK